jgi:hypothetical protein
LGEQKRLVLFDLDDVLATGLMNLGRRGGITIDFIGNRLYSAHADLQRVEKQTTGISGRNWVKVGRV